MSNDPIVAEIHKIREQMWEECHGSTEEFAARQMEFQRKHPEGLIDPVEWKKRRKGKEESAG